MIFFNELYLWLLDQVHNNQFFAGLAIPFALTVVAYVFRSIPNKIYHWIKLITTLEFTLTSKNEHYDEILRFLYDHRFTLFSRNYSISGNSKYLTPGYGMSVGMYKGVLFIFKREIYEQKIDLQENTHITFLTRNLTFINKFFSESTKKDKSQIIAVYNQSHSHFNKICDRPKRSLETVFINNHIKEDVIEKIKWFLQNEKWYLQRGISYKLCIVFHGLPGTGKTSLIHAVASYFDYDIKLIKDLTYVDSIFADNTDLYNEHLPTTLEEAKIQSVFVIEDIDCLNLSKRANIDDDAPVPAGERPPILPSPTLMSTMNNMILQRVLNTLDGIGTPHGRIILITTNDLDSLDPALIRKGRVDLILNIDKLDSEQFIAMFSSFYEAGSKHLASAFIKSGKYKPKVGAEFSDLFLNNTPDKSIQILEAEFDNAV